MALTRWVWSELPLRRVLLDITRAWKTLGFLALVPGGSIKGRLARPSPWVQEDSMGQPQSWGRAPEGAGPLAYWRLLPYIEASLVTQMVKNPPAMQETTV